MEVDPEIACGIVGNIGQLWLKEQFIDLQINIDDCKFYCNRFILCACCEFFHVLLKSEVKGEVVHHVRQVNIRGISPGIFQLVLNAIYKGENGLNMENMIEFWHAVHELQIPVLVSTCETFISSHMSRENVLGVYTSALLLQSEKIVKIVQEFMADNFEYISRCQIFLLLSSKVLHEILSDRNLKVDTPDNLAKSILKWVSHEPCGNNAGTSCAGDILEVRDTNIVSDQRLDHSADVINDHTGSVEVILQVPPASSQDSCRQIVAQFLTETPAARRESLGRLLKLSQLGEASRDCLEMLADLDMIMGVKETRDVVKQALAAHSTARESVQYTVLPTNSVAPDDGLSLATEHVVVFVKEYKMYAYSLARNKFFNFLPDLSFWSVANYYTFNNCIFITEKTNTQIIMTVHKFPFSQNSTTVFNSVGSCSVVVSGFCYTFKANGLYRKRCDAESCNWFQVIDFKKEINCVLVNIFKDNIIFRDEATLYCFNTTTPRFWDIMTIDMRYAFVTFIHNDQLYVVTHDGYLWNITAKVDPSITNSCDVDIKITPDLQKRLNDAHCQKMASRSSRRVCNPLFNPIGTHVQEKLWDGSYTLLCCVVYADKLVIFADLNSRQASVIKNQILAHGLPDIHFAHLDAGSKCFPLTVPSTMLVTEV